MPRPPLPIGTSGRVRTYRTRSGWRSRTTYRNYDGITREVQCTAAARPSPSGDWRPRLRDRVYRGGGSELTSESRLSRLRRLGLPKLGAAASVRRRCRHTDINSTDTFWRRWAT